MKTIAKIFIIIVVWAPAPLLAETFEEINVEQVFVEKKAVVKDFLQLTEKERAVFWPLYDEYQKKLMMKFTKYRALIRVYMQEHENLSEKKAKEMTVTLMEIQADDLKNKHTYIKKFREKLTAKRVFQYFVLEDQIEAGFFSMILENLPAIK